jgi:hypothetical protein
MTVSLFWKHDINFSEEKKMDVISELKLWLWKNEIVFKMQDAIKVTNWRWKQCLSCVSKKQKAP